MLSIYMMTLAYALTDKDVTAALLRLARDERETTTALIVHLAEFDARRLYEGAGFSSMFKYCRAVLHLSAEQEYQVPPMSLPPVSSLPGSPPSALSPESLSQYDAVALFIARARAARKGRRGVEALLARRFPKADVAASVRKLPAPRMVPVASVPAIDSMALVATDNASPCVSAAVGAPPNTPGEASPAIPIQPRYAPS